MYRPGSGQYFRPAIKVSSQISGCLQQHIKLTHKQAHSYSWSPKSLYIPPFSHKQLKLNGRKVNNLCVGKCVDEPCANPRPPNKTRRKEFALIEFKGKQDMIHDIRRTSSIAAQRIWNSGSTNHPGILKSSIPSQESNWDIKRHRTFPRKDIEHSANKLKNTKICFHRGRQVHGQIYSSSSTSLVPRPLSPSGGISATVTRE